MKNLKFLILFFLFPLFGFSQSLSGIWTGVLSNDSLTIRKDQSFEMALTEYRGKVYGYAYSTFIVNDTLYYIIKRVKGNIDGDICEVEDDEVITHNFPKKPEKGVNVIYTFRRSGNDSIWKLDGNWKTNATKKYYSISGNVKAKEEKDLSKSKLYDHLGDLNLQNTLAFNKPKESKTEINNSKIKEPKEELVKIKQKPADDKSTAEIKKPDAVVAVTQKQDVKTDIVKTEPKPVDNKPSTETAKAEIKKPDAVVAVTQKQDVKTDIVKTEAKPVDNKPSTETAKAEIKKPDAVVAAPQKQDLKTDIVKTETKPVDKKPTAETAKAEIKKPDAVVAAPQKQDLKTDIAIPKTIGTEQPVDEKKSSPDYIFSDLKRTTKKLKPAASMIEGRESAPSETIFFKSDSLVLALYDNGEVDGDTVSVILNGELIIEKQGLKSSAFKKTIYLSPEEGDSVLLVLYAENLGIYPPNTGLLIVKDGEESYYVRFKADYDRNAAILLRKKLK